MHVCVLGRGERWPDVGGGTGGGLPLVTFGAGIGTTPGLLGQLPLHQFQKAWIPVLLESFPSCEGGPPWKKPEKTLSHVRSLGHLRVCGAQPKG